MAHAVVSRKLAALGGTPVLRVKDGRPVVTDNGGAIIDVHGLRITDPVGLETEINNIVGVITNGLFARHGAGVCLLGRPDGVETLTFA